MKLKLRYVDLCDSCEHLEDLNVIGGFRKCKIYNQNMLQDEAILLTTKGRGFFTRPQKCIDENETEIRK